MADARVGRFFSPVKLLIALGLLLLGLLAGAYGVYIFLDEGVISIKWGILVLALLVGSVATLIAAFPMGCKACRKKFDQTRASFAPNLFEHLVQVFQSGDPNAIAQLGGAPLGDPAGQKAVVNLYYCGSCRALSEVQVSLEHWTGQYNEVDRSHPSFVIAGPAVAAALTLVDQIAARYRTVSAP